MKLTRKWIILNILIFFILLGGISRSVFAAESNPVQPTYNGYRISDFRVSININKDRSLDVTENISADFILLKHGIYRTIPLSGTMKYNENGSVKTKRYLAKVTDISVKDSKTQSNLPYSVESSDNNKFLIKIGDSNKQILGKQTYQLQYHYSIMEDTLEKESFFSFNLIGTGWDTSIGNVSFQVELPDSLNQEGIHLYVGQNGSKNTDRLEYFLDQNILVGKVNGYLEAGEGITLLLDTPDGYFVTPRSNLFSSVSSLFFLAATSILFVLCKKYGWRKRNKTLPMNVNWNRSPAQLCYMLNGSVNDRAIASMLIYWAEKGYMQIVEEKNIVLRLVKLVDMKEDEKDYEKQMFHQLFSNRESVVAKELGTDFYQIVRDFKNGVVAEFQMQGIDLYDRKAKRLLLMTSFVSAVMVVVMVGYAMNFFNVGIGGMLLTVVISIFIAVCSMLLSFVCSSLSDARKQGRYIGFVIAISSYIVILGLLAFSLGNLMLNLPFYILGIMCAFLCTLFGTWINILSNEGEELEVEALSYLAWLKEQLKMYGYSDSKQEFKYQKLSYFYFFGLSKTMLKLLQDIRFSSPDWYYCMHTSTFTPLYFLSSMESGMNSFASSSSPSSDSGSGGAGGGAGGGGGGSW